MKGWAYLVLGVLALDGVGAIMGNTDHWAVSVAMFFFVMLYKFPEPEAKKK